MVKARPRRNIASRSRRSRSIVTKSRSRRAASAKTKRGSRKPKKRTSSAKSRIVKKRSKRKVSARRSSAKRVKRKGVKRRASSSRKHSRSRATKRKRIGPRSRKRSSSRKRNTSARKVVLRPAPKKPKSRTRNKRQQRVLGSPKRRRESVVNNYQGIPKRRHSMAPSLISNSSRSSLSGRAISQRSSLSGTKTPAAMTKREKRMRRLTRTAADTRRLKPRKGKANTSGPVDINSYSYGVLYNHFLDEFLPKLCKDNGVHTDKRSCGVMKAIFEPSEEAADQYEVEPSPTMLKKAQQAVLTEIDRQEKQSKRAGRISGMERMFYLATGERDLAVDFDMMRKMVREAKLARFRGDDFPDMGYMDPNINRIKINSGHRMTMYDIKVTLMHEVMHGTIKRSGRPGNPEISEVTEHLAMALCGDPDEFTLLLPKDKLVPPPCEFSEMDSDYEDVGLDEQPQERPDEDWDYVYLQSQLKYLSKLGFDMDDIPDIVSPEMRGRIESQLPRTPR